MTLLRSSFLCRAAEFGILTIILGIALYAQNGYNFTTIDFPGGISTQGRGINAQGDIVGVYADPSTGLFHGFRLSASRYSKIDFPGAVQTYPRSINKKRDIVGFFVDASGVFHGFLLNSGGFHQIDVPGSLGTAVRAITDNGLVVGDTTFDNISNECFVLKKGMYDTFSFPGQTVNTCVGISRRGDVLGYYSTDSDFGFLRRLGRFTPLNVPGDPIGMNDLNQVVGITGYMADIATVTPVKPPGAISTAARGINAGGVIVGNYLDASEVAHGFIATPIP